MPADYAGLDFGTSNCLIALWREGAPHLVELEAGETALPSLVYVPRTMAPIPEPSSAWIAQASRAADARTRGGRAAPAAGASAGALAHAPSRATLEADVRAAFAREATAQALEAMQSQTLQEALRHGAQPQFGRQALRSSLDDIDGFFFRSPKSFLAADIDAAFRVRFERIVELMLAHLREQASIANGREVIRACIGRPVHFGGGAKADQERGDARAVSLLEAAARRAGFQELHFEFEPVAAALDFERQLDRDQVVLIVDVGGGTTDCTLARLGPGRTRKISRADDILAATGDRLGGNDVDTSLSFAGLMTAMGRGDTELSGLPVPATPFADAADVFSVPAQAAFFRAEHTLAAMRRRCAPAVAARLQRLEVLRQTQQTLWLTMKAEQAKVELARIPDVEVALDRLEPNLTITLHQSQLEPVFRPLLRGIARLMTEAVDQGGSRPDLLYVTGGSANAPLVQAVIRQLFPDTPVVMGDAYGSVVAGLAIQAERLFSQPRSNAI